MVAFGNTGALDTTRSTSHMIFIYRQQPLTSNNFEIEFEFHIGGQSGHLYGDGLASKLSIAPWNNT